MIMRIGNPDAPQIMFLQPFFEEANRLRRLIACVMRDVVDAGFGAALPDLPGTGESMTALHEVEFVDWRAAVAAASASIETPKLVISFRSAALIDDAANAQHIWRCAPETGQRVIRDLMRTRLTATTAADSNDGTVHVAGHRIKQSLITALEAAAPSQSGTVRTAQLNSSAAAADVSLPGTPLWRRSEPGEDAELRAAISSDIISWAKQCAGR